MSIITVRAARRSGLHLAAGPGRVSAPPIRRGSSGDSRIYPADWSPRMRG